MSTPTHTPATHAAPVRVPLLRGVRATITVAASEVSLHMRVAGATMGVEIVGERYPVAQLYKDNQPFSFPIHLSEAGIYRDVDSYYGYITEEVLPQTDTMHA